MSLNRLLLLILVWVIFLPQAYAQEKVPKSDCAILSKVTVCQSIKDKNAEGIIKPTLESKGAHPFIVNLGELSAGEKYFHFVLDVKIPSELYYIFAIKPQGKDEFQYETIKDETGLIEKSKGWRTWCNKTLVKGQYELILMDQYGGHIGTLIFSVK